MTAKTEDYNLQNYIKLEDVISNTLQQLIDKEIVISNRAQIKEFRRENRKLLTFNTLIATGYNVITILNNNDLIKTNFDFASNNTDVILDFNYNEFIKLVENTGAKQKKLI